MAAWTELNPSLSKSTLNVLHEIGFKTMTPVQVKNHSASNSPPDRASSFIYPEFLAINSDKTSHFYHIPTFKIRTFLTIYFFYIEERGNSLVFDKQRCCCGGSEHDMFYFYNIL
jgi:hypothetical protein